MKKNGHTELNFLIESEIMGKIVLIPEKEDCMRINFCRTVLVLFILFTASGALAESSVWVASSAKAKVYLAGSFHILRNSDYPLPDEFSTAYKDSRKIVFEAPLGDESSMANLLGLAIYTDGTTLKDHISKAAYAKAESFCRERNYPIEQFKLFKPSFFIMTLTILEMTRIGADPQKGIDSFFKEKALQDGKTTGSLETIDEQINLLASINENIGSDQILESIGEFKQIETMLEESLTVWKKGDEPGMENLFIKEMKNYPQLYKSIIIDRNNKWMTKITDYLNGSTNTMVIVGAAHLVGPDGLVNLMRKKGYKVTKLQK
jgi:uncharacterized protein YbaP (TraB family)